MAIVCAALPANPQQMGSGMGASVAVSVIGLVTAIFNILRTALGRATRPSARQRAEKAAHDARAASAQGDTAAINTAIERERIRRTLLALCCGLLCAGCIPLPVPVVRGAGGDGWSGWKIGLSWGVGPDAVEIAEESGGAGAGAACGSSCSAGGGR